MTPFDDIVRVVGETANYIDANLATHAGSDAGTNPSGDDQNCR